MIFIMSCLTCSGQEVKSLLLFSNSFSIEFAAPITYLLEEKSSVNLIILPLTFLTYEKRLSKKFYGEVAFSPEYRIEGLSIPKNSTYQYSFSFTTFLGIIYKKHFFNNLYFTPSFDLYYSFYKDHSYYNLSENRDVLTAGPTIGFEYFISKRLSINTDLLNLNFGFRFAPETPTLYSNGSPHEVVSYVTIYKTLSLGIHYTFDWKKK